MHMATSELGIFAAENVKLKTAGGTFPPASLCSIKTPLSHSGAFAYKLQQNVSIPSPVSQLFLTMVKAHLGESSVEVFPCTYVRNIQSEISVKYYETYV